MKLIILIILTTQIFACSTLDIGQYQPDFNTVNNLKDIDSKSMAVGDFSEADPKLNKVSLRGTPMTSQHDGSYGKYLKYSLEEQLAQADILSDKSNFIISGTLLENDVSAAGVSTGSAKLAAQFVISESGKEIYNQEHEIYHEWESSFVGAIAIPRAQENYPIAVKKLINDFLSDEDVIKYLSK